MSDFTSDRGAPTRQTGRTSQQMMGAPPGAVFVWCNSHLLYANAMAHELGRDDLVIIPLCRLNARTMMLMRCPGVVVDHMARIPSDGWDAIARLRGRGIPVVTW